MERELELTEIAVMLYESGATVENAVAEVLKIREGEKLLQDNEDIK